MPVWTNALAEAAAEARLLTQGVVATATSHLLALMFRRQAASTKNTGGAGEGGCFEPGISRVRGIVVRPRSPRPEITNLRRFSHSEADRDCCVQNLEQPCLDAG